jgi:hypothetical protein
MMAILWVIGREERREFGWGMMLGEEKEFLKEEMKEFGWELLKGSMLDIEMV